MSHTVSPDGEETLKINSFHFSCLLPKKIEMFDLLKDPKIFLLDERKSVDFILAASLLFEQMIQKVWLKAKIVDFEINLVLLYNPDKPSIGKMVLRNSEAGIISRSYDCIDTAARASCRSSKISLFESLESYTEFSSGFTDLVVENFKYILLNYFLVCSLVFVAFGLHHLIKIAKSSPTFLWLLSSSYSLTKRWARRLSSASKRYWSGFVSGCRIFARYLSSGEIFQRFR